MCNHGVNTDIYTFKDQLAKQIEREKADKQ